jgi:two-component system LytT family sensor kinase
MTRETWRAPSSALVVWLFLAAAQTALIVGLSDSRTSAWIVAASFAAHAFTWTAITLGVRRVRRLLPEGAMRMLAWFFLLGAAGLLDALVRRGVTGLLIGPPSVNFGRTVLYYADVTTLSFILAVWLGRVIDTREALFAQAQHELALKAQLGRARLGYLHAQLQPHFLFNALGAVSELIFENPSAAIRTFRQLTAVLRAAASRDAAEVTLREELGILSPYLDVQRTRFSDWLEIEVNMDPAAEELLVPALVLQPLVENSIRHGLRDRSSRGRISIVASVTGSRLVLSVRDNGAGLRSPVTMRRSGVGLSNTKERLATLYGSDASLRLFNDESGGAIAEVTLPLRRAAIATTTEVAAAPAGDVSRDESFADRHPIAALVMGCLAASFLWTQQSYAYLTLSGRLEDRSPLDLARDDFFLVAVWTAMVPVVVWISRRFPFERSVLRGVAGHVVALATLGALHSALVSVYRNDLDLSAWLTNFRGSMPVTLLVYLGSLLWAQRRVLEDWLSARQTEALRISSEITDAKFAAASLSVPPERLDFALAELERCVVSDPLQAERIIAELGSELRSSLENVGMDRGADRPSGGGGSPRREDRVERLAMGA